MDEEIGDGNDGLLGYRMKTFLVPVIAAVIVSVLMVGSIVWRVFLKGSFDNSKEGMQSFVRKRVVPGLETKYSSESNSGFTCEGEGVESLEKGEYEADVRCESAEKTVELSVALTHDGDSVSWEDEIEQTKRK
jgi:hypothetical protein